MAKKIINDSVHGYIYLDSMASHIVDSAEFQRLKSIEQGSFRVVYPAARHDRFIHSLGTYYLSKKVGVHFIDNIYEDLNIELDKLLVAKITNTFYYAALLHDIGHAPFSHTTEKFFVKKATEGTPFINVQLFNAVESISTEKSQFEIFKKEFSEISPSPHEIMSATLLINKSKDFLMEHLKDIDLELAARMVLGSTYDYNNHDITRHEIKNELGVKNCFIRLLNSEIVDIDKMDYIKRDTQMSGFFNVPIDIERIVSSVTAVFDDEGCIYPAFRKSSLSVIDNVFRAKSEQAQWMVSHPIVKYDSELLSFCINSLSSRINANYIEEVFSMSALGKEGVTLEGKKYRLLCDTDIHSDLRKHYDDCDLIRELYERDSRRKPIWKSYYEYKYLFSDLIEPDGDDFVLRYFKPLVDTLQLYDIFVLNDKSFNSIEVNESIKNEVKAVALFLKDFCESENIPFDLTLITSTGNFNTKFDSKKVYITFSKLPKKNGKNFETYEFLKEPTKNENKPFFFIYSKQKFKPEHILRFKEKLSAQKKPIKKRA